MSLLFLDLINSSIFLYRIDFSLGDSLGGGGLVQLLKYDTGVLLSKVTIFLIVLQQVLQTVDSGWSVFQKF